MRAAWWWIDRWRRSTAYTDMTAEEQGVYRNLLDECWLRGGVIPDDDFALKKISGDPDAWPRVRKKVLDRFKKCEGGLRNETADEVIAKSSSLHQVRSEAGKRGNKARWGGRKPIANGVASPIANGSSPSPSPSPSKSKTQRPRKRSSGTAVAVLGHNWSKDACDDWIERFGGTAPGGRIGKALKPLIAKYGWELIRPVWQRYLRDEKPEFANPQDFASKLGRWLQRRVPKTKGEHFVEKTREVLEAFLENH
jgi:uncharacterized protein YdaU (DUF1376 family)